MIPYQKYPTMAKLTIRRGSRCNWIVSRQRVTENLGQAQPFQYKARPENAAYAFFIVLVISTGPVSQEYATLCGSGID
jgi:hypothetical protein